MTKKKSLKQQNIPMIYSFITLNIVVGYIFIFVNNPTLEIANKFLEKVSAEQGIFTLLIPFFALILTNILSSNTKAKIVFFRFLNPLPGSRAFSKYIYKDSRIVTANLEKKYSPFPIEGNNQNSLWYKIYKKHVDKIVIVDSHRKFLLVRDLSTISILLLLIFPIAWIIFKIEITKSTYYLIYLSLQFLLLNLSARNLGIRFTCNVLAEESVN